MPFNNWVAGAFWSVAFVLAVYVAWSGHADAYVILAMTAAAATALLHFFGDIDTPAIQFAECTLSAPITLIVLNGLLGRATTVDAVIGPVLVWSVVFAIASNRSFQHMYFKYPSRLIALGIYAYAWHPLAALVGGGVYAVAIGAVLLVTALLAAYHYVVAYTALSVSVRVWLLVAIVYFKVLPASMQTPGFLVGGGLGATACGLLFYTAAPQPIVAVFAQKWTGMVGF
jgi:hypothetical protein